MNRDGVILPDDVVRESNCALDALGGWITQIHIDLTRSFKHTETPSGRVEKRHECLRENVLSRVLLDVVPPAGPVHTPVHSFITQRRLTFNQVQQTIVSVVDALDHSHVIERSGVAWLTAAGGIKRSAIEHDRGPTADAITLVHNTSVKLQQMGIGIVESFGYRHMIHRLLRFIKTFVR